MNDIALQGFAQKVTETSRQIPVLVDLWMPWCSPCHTLGPMLEKLKAEYTDKWKLAKANSDKNPELSVQFHMCSISYVVAFIDGKPVNQFIGVLPEAQLRTFLNRAVSQPVEVAHREGLAVSQAGGTAPTREAFQDALAFDPGFDAVRFAPVNLLLDTGDAHAAQGELALFSPKAPQGARYALLETRLKATERADTLPDVGALHAAVQAQPDNLQTRSDPMQ